MIRYSFELRCIVFLIKAAGNNLWNNVGNLL